MHIIGNLNNLNKEVSKHVDEDDCKPVLFHLGFPRKNRETYYYSGLTYKNHGKFQQQTQCEHGRKTIGHFDKIVHSAEPWEGNCACINFNLNKKVLEHFLKHGTKIIPSLKTTTYHLVPFLHVRKKFHN